MNSNPVLVILNGLAAAVAELTKKPAPTKGKTR